MKQRINQACFWAAALLTLPTLALAQSWPEPPEVSGAFTEGHLEEAVKLEPGPLCSPTRQPIECTDAEVQAYQERLHEAIAAALARMPDTEGRWDIAPSSLQLFGGRMAGCRRDGVRACSSNQADLREKYPALANMPDLDVDICAPIAEKACKIANLSERIVEWNARNTEKDAAPVTVFHDPGFDCTNSRNPAALMTICGDANLSKLHRMVVEKNASLREIGDLSLLPPEYRALGDLRRETFDCRDSKDCIRPILAQRIADLDAASITLTEAVQLAEQQEVQKAEEDAQRREAEVAQREAEIQLRVQNLLPEAREAFPPQSFLHQILMQNFAAADQIAQDMALEIWDADFAGTVRILAPGMSDTLRQAAINNRKNLVLAAYGLTRYERLGACGDQITIVERLVSERQVSRNIYNVIISDIPAQYSRVDTPVNFARFVENTIFERGGRYFSSEVDAIGACDSDLRLFLEESLFSYARWRA